MSDIERIHALRDAGHITPEEAERLIGVLIDLDGPAEGAGAANGTSAAPETAAADAAPDAAAAPNPPAPGRDETVGATVAASVRSAVRDSANAAREAAAAAREAAAGAREAAAGARAHAREAAATAREHAREATHTGGTTRTDPTPIDLAPAGTRWCTIELTASDLTVVAADVAEPQVEADDAQEIVVTPTDDGLRVTARRGSTIDRWIGRTHAPKTAVRLPRGWGVGLDLRAGDASVRDVPYVRGRMVAGDLEVHGAEAVDVSKAAGDLTVVFRPTHGRHRITAKAGDVDVRFLPGSDATVEASVSMGDLDVPGGFDVQRRMVGAQARGRFGAGTARVEVRLAAGDLSVRVPTEEV